MVAAGAEHSVAVTEDGELYGWGWGRYGNLGLGDRNDRSIPEKVSSFHVCPQPSNFLIFADKNVMISFIIWVISDFIHFLILN